MKYWSVLIIGLLLTGCAGSSLEIDEQLKDITQSYEEKIDDLESKYELELNKKDEVIAHIEKNVEEVTREHRKLLDELKVKEDNFNKTISPVEDKFVRLYSEGSKYLEDGIVCILEVYDSSMDLTWMASWNGLQVSELATYSEYNVVNGVLYIVVDGMLYTMDFITGEELWTLDDIGYPFVAPLIDQEGMIFTICQYAPYISAIDSKGNLLWQENSDLLYGTNKIEFDGDYLLIDCFEGIIKYDKKGNQIK